MSSRSSVADLLPDGVGHSCILACTSICKSIGLGCGSGWVMTGIPKNKCVVVKFWKNGCTRSCRAVGLALAREVGAYTSHMLRGPNSLNLFR